MVNKTPAALFLLIKSLAGVNDFTTEEETNLKSLAERRLRMAYNLSPMWERYVVTSEERKLCSYKVSGLIDSNIYYKIDGGYYKLGSNSDGSVTYYIQARHDYGNQPIVLYKTATDKRWVFVKSTSLTVDDDGVVSLSSNPPAITQKAKSDGTYTDYATPAEVKQWTIVDGNISGFPVVEEVSLVQYDETYFFSDLTSGGKTGKDTIQDFIRIHGSNAFMKNSATEYDFYVDDSGAHVINAGDESSVFVTYKKPLVFPNPSGSSNDLLLGFTSQYEQIPLEFFNYTAHGTYADFLRMDGQHDKAAFEEQKADMFLATELERIDIINNNNSLNHKFSTYVNRSTR
jgi:hypothetical protein